MAAATWKKVETSALLEKLQHISKSMREILPAYVEKQTEALKRMAETAIVANGGTLPQKGAQNE